MAGVVSRGMGERPTTAARCSMIPTGDVGDDQR
jgi:hypothetical protein